MASQYLLIIVKQQIKIIFVIAVEVNAPEALCAASSPYISLAMRTSNDVFLLP